MKVYQKRKKILGSTPKKYDTETKSLRFDFGHDRTNLKVS